VNYTALVRVLQRFCDLAGDRQRVLKWDCDLRDAICKGLTFHQLHHKCPPLDAVDDCDIWVIQRRQHLRLAREARYAVGIAREGVRQDLIATSRFSLVSVARQT
jgi:hypothetical protein